MLQEAAGQRLEHDAAWAGGACWPGGLVGARQGRAPLIFGGADGAACVECCTCGVHRRWRKAVGGAPPAAGLQTDIPLYRRTFG